MNGQYSSVSTQVLLSVHAVSNNNKVVDQEQVKGVDRREEFERIGAEALLLPPSPPTVGTLSEDQPDRWESVEESSCKTTLTIDCTAAAQNNIETDTTF